MKVQVAKHWSTVTKSCDTVLFSLTMAFQNVFTDVVACQTQLDIEVTNFIGILLVLKKW